MEFKGTKGKWELKDYTILNPNRNADKGNIFDIAQCFMGFNQHATRDECKANALLISKAPEMLEMLIRLVDRMEENDLGSQHSVKRAKQLIEEAIKIN